MSILFGTKTTFARAVLPNSCQFIFKVAGLEKVVSREEVYNRLTKNWRYADGHFIVVENPDGKLKAFMPKLFPNKVGIVATKDQKTDAIRWNSKNYKYSYEVRGSTEGYFSSDSKSWVMENVDRIGNSGEDQTVIQVWNFTSKRSILVTHVLKHEAQGITVRFEKKPIFVDGVLKKLNIILIHYTVIENGIGTEYIYTYERATGRFLREEKYEQDEWG